MVFFLNPAHLDMIKAGKITLSRKDSLMETTYEAAASSGLSFTGTETARVVRNLIMTRDANELIADLAQETGLSEGDVLRVALGIFKVAVNARKEGKHVGVARSPEALDLELTGF